MSSTDRGILDRFRGILQGRVRDLRSLVELLEEMPGEEEAIRQVLGLVHTLKGESRMLGLLPMAALAHSIETHLSDAAPEMAKVLQATDALWEVLDSPDAGQAMVELERIRIHLFDEQPGTAATAQSTGSEPQADSGVSEKRKLETPQSSATSAPDSDDTPRSSTLTAVEENSQQTEPGTSSGASANQRWVQVDAAMVDDLCDRIGELSSTLGYLQHQLENLGPNPTIDHVRELRERATQCRSGLDGCAGVAWSLRLLPLAPILGDLTQHGRALARNLGKSIRFETQAAGVQLERDVVEQIWDSLLHIVRNCIDHGLETSKERGSKPEQGLLRISAWASGPNVILKIEDDGRGIDEEVIRCAAVSRGLYTEERAARLERSELLGLLFEHGFSTRSEVGELSGRGVGLDVVRQRLQSLGGNVNLSSELGRGTQFVLTVPVAISKERVLLIECGDALMGIPTRSVVEVTSIPAFSQKGVVRFNGQALPARSLSGVLRLHATSEDRRLLVLDLGGRLHALMVNQVLGEREVIRRPSARLLQSLGGVSGSAVLDDGRLVLILSHTHLARAFAGSMADAPLRKGAVSGAQQQVLVVDDSPVVTEMVSELLTASGFKVRVASTGVEALSALEEEIPSLVLSDVEMPQMNGFELLERIRRKNDRLPVVMLTTRGSIEDRRRASSLGANAFVLKTDFRSEELLNVVRRYAGVMS